MIAEQLQAARAAHWRQQNNPLLTLADAEAWLQQHPLCLFLPRRTQLPVPAPSFVEACLGSAQATPDAAAIAQAQSLLTRLTAEGTVVPLNLLGTPGEQPDFLATREALPFVLSLRAEADWKHAPQKSSGHRVSPLVMELWKLLDEKGSMTAEEAREALGREVTEAAVLRALAELWQGLRISPVYGEDGAPARWEMLRVRHREALTTATNTGQVTALSLLVSMYLQSVYTATSEEIEIFLSPAASRSRAREAVRGLAATRQIHSLSMDAQTYYFLKDGLPEFATTAVADAGAVAGAPPVTGERLPVTPVERKPVRPRESATRGGWQSPQRDAGRRPPVSLGASGEGVEARPERPARFEKSGLGTKMWRPKENADPSSRGDARAGGAQRGRRDSSASRARGGAGRPPFKAEPGGDRKRFAPGGAKPWPPKQNADLSTSLRSGRDDIRAGGPQGARGGRRDGGAPHTGGGAERPRGGAGRPPFKAGPAGDRKRFAPGGAKPWRSKQNADPSTSLRSGRDDIRSGGSQGARGRRRDGGASPARGGAERPRGGAERPPFKAGPGGDRKRFAPGGAKPWRPKQNADPSTSLRSGRDDIRAGGPQGRRGDRRDGDAERPRGGARRPPFKAGPGGDRKRFAPVDGKPWRPKQNADPSTSVRFGSPQGARGGRRDDGAAPARGGAGRPRGGEGRPPFKPRAGAEGAKPWRSRPGADRPGRDNKGEFRRPGKPSRPRAGGKGRPPFSPRPRKKPDA